MPSSVFSHTWGGRDRGTADLGKGGGEFKHYGPSGESEMRKGMYNDKETGDIWATDGTYLGSIKMEEGLKNAELKALHTKYKKDPDNEFNSHNDIAGAIQKTYAAGEYKPPTEGKTFNDYEFSPQVQEAMDRAKQYRDRAWSGQHAQDVYGRSNELAKDNTLGIDRGNPDAGVTDQNGAAAAADNHTASHFDQEKYRMDLANEIKNRQANR